MLQGVAQGTDKHFFMSEVQFLVWGGSQCSTESQLYFPRHGCAVQGWLGSILSLFPG